MRASTAYLLVAMSFSLACSGGSAESPGAGQPLATDSTHGFCSAPEEVGSEICLAFETLSNTEFFLVGKEVPEGAFPRTTDAFNRLVDDPRAAEAFRALATVDSHAARLYALSGLYLTDQAAFSDLLRELEHEPGKVRTVLGFITFEEKVSKFVRDDDPKTVRLSNPSQTLREWVAANPEHAAAGYRLDIAGGGIPAEFRELKDK